MRGARRALESEPDRRSRPGGKRDQHPDQLKSADLETIVGEVTWTAGVAGEKKECHGEVEPGELGGGRYAGTDMSFGGGF